MRFMLFKNNNTLIALLFVISTKRVTNAAYLLLVSNIISTISRYVYELFTEYIFCKACIHFYFILEYV